MKEIMVTVVIPNYNHHEFLEARIESVLNQSFQDFEIFILDDASTDKSIDVIERYRNHAKVKGIFLNETNSGSVFKQWLKAFELAETEFMWIAESDDIAHPEFLEETITAANIYKNTGFVFTDSVLVDASGKLINGTPFNTLANLNPALGKLSLYNIDSMDVGRFFINQLLVGNASSVVFKVEALKGIDKMVLKNFKNAGDVFTYLHIIFDYDCVYINKPLNYFRQHENNTTKSNNISGVLALERMQVVNFYFDKLVFLTDAKVFLIFFLKRHILPAIDYGHFKELKKLLHTYKKYKLLNDFQLIKLKSLLRMAKIESVKDSLWFRNKIKSHLELL